MSGSSPGGRWECRRPQEAEQSRWEGRRRGRGLALSSGSGSWVQPVCLADPVLSPSCWPRPCGCLRTQGPAPFCAGLLLPDTPHFRSPGPRSSGVGWCQVGLRAHWGAFLFESSSSPRKIQEPGDGATASTARGRHGPIWCYRYG